MKDASVRPVSARRPKREQQIIAVIGVCPSFVLPKPNVSLTNVLP